MLRKVPVIASETAKDKKVGGESFGTILEGKMTHCLSASSPCPKFKLTLLLMLQPFAKEVACHFQDSP